MTGIRGERSLTGCRSSYENKKNMGMDEFTAILMARQFIKKAGITEIPVDLARCAAAINARIETRYDLSDDESGQTFALGGQNIILVNGNQREERQRFTVLHEIGHVVLELPSQHGGQKLTASGLASYTRRPPEEMLCDVFAAECLLPYDFFTKDIDGVDVSFNAIREIAGRYKASVISTGSRLAAHSAEPCAFVLMESGVTRYASLSKALRELGGWIDLGVPAPARSVAARLLKDASSADTYDELAAIAWFNKPLKNYETVCEEAMLAREWDQCLSLLWFDESLRRSTTGNGDADNEDEPLLKELDGVLPWPDKSRRR